MLREVYISLFHSLWSEEVLEGEWCNQHWPDWFDLNIVDEDIADTLNSPTDFLERWRHWQYWLKHDVTVLRCRRFRRENVSESQLGRVSMGHHHLGWGSHLRTENVDAVFYFRVNDPTWKADGFRIVTIDVRGRTTLELLLVSRESRWPKKRTRWKWASCFWYWKKKKKHESDIPERKSETVVTGELSSMTIE